jgi:DNA-binding MarR family transcriptional regulator
MKSAKKWFGKVNKSVLTDPEISSGAKALYALLCCYKDSENICNPGITRLAEELNIGYSTCKKWLKELSDKKIISRSQKDQRSTSETIILK